MREAVSRALRGWAERDGRGYPDWALRYAPVVRRLKPRAGERVLEVGANENGLARFAPATPVAVDRSPAHCAAARAAQGIRPVVADIAALPFSDGAFDVVVCMDVFEHLPDGMRPAAAESLCRVLAPNGRAAVTFPTGDVAADAERRIRDAYAAHTGRTIGWLEEHAAHGLPAPDAVAAHFEAALQRLGRTQRVRRAAGVPAWLWTAAWKVLMCGWPGRGNALAQALLRALTPILTRIRAGAPYRVALHIEPEATKHE